MRRDTALVFENIIKKQDAKYFEGLRNPVVVDGDVAKIYCYSPKREQIDYFIIDVADIPTISIECTWVTRARKSETKKRVYSSGMPLVKLLMNAKEGMHVDHINRDTLDNRRCNLREVTPKVNLSNKDIYKNSKTGVCGLHIDGNIFRVAFIRRFVKRETAEIVAREISNILDKYSKTT
jgi:hypothetical protein